MYWHYNEIHNMDCAIVDVIALDARECDSVLGFPRRFHQNSRDYFRL